MEKKKILISSDFSLAKTGFGRVMKSLITHLYKTGKYEIVHYCCGVNYSAPFLQKTPWKSIGCLPDTQKEIDIINKDPVSQRSAAYGSYLLDKVISQEKPDIYIASQDIWGVDFAVGKYWWNKIPCVIWTTLDSLPILPSAVSIAQNVKNYWVWSNFAEKALHKLGHKHVKTVHGPIEDSLFYKLPSSKKQELRKKLGISPESFVSGFVFRNQLRKSVPNLLEGFSIFKRDNPECKSPKLLLHTSYSEGWNINKLAAEYSVPESDILTTYICRVCGEYDVSNFSGEDRNCRFCGGQKCVSTTNVNKGVSEEQLNEIYNLMDVYVHPISSGGQEVPVLEAKLVELITLVTNYSCGEELCEDGSGSLPLDWSEYREFGTEFIKSSTFPSSISKQMTKVFRMGEEKRAQQGKTNRDWALRNYSIKVIGQFFEQFLDSCPKENYDFIPETILKNPDAVIPEGIKDDLLYIKTLYKEILKMEVKDDDSGVKHWMESLKQQDRRNVEDYFRKVAKKENEEKAPPKDISDILDKDDEGRRILFSIPESIGDVFLCTSLFPSIKRVYPKYNLYVATKPENFEILDGNPNIHKVIPFIPEMENIFTMEGIGAHKGYFNISFMPYVSTQRIIDYTHNAEDIVEFDLKNVCHI